MYYGLLAFTVCLFGAAFAVNQQYQKRMGSGFFVAFFFSALSACGGICILYPTCGKKLKPLPAAIGVSYGLLNWVANWLLVITLIGIPASVQFPIVTGGVMVVSTTVSCFSAKKPTKKQFLALGVALFGIILIALVPG